MEYYFDVITEEELYYFHKAAIGAGKLDFDREMVMNSPVSNRMHLATLYAHRKDRENYLRIMAACETEKERRHIREGIWGCLPSEYRLD